MLTVLYGQDSYRRIQKLNEIIKSYHSDSTGVIYGRFDLSQNDSFFELRDFISTPSMFAKLRLVILDGLPEASYKKEIKKLLESFAGLKSTVIVMNLDKKPPATYKFLLDTAHEKHEYAALDGQDIAGFIKSVAEEKGTSLSPDTAKLIKEVYGGDTWGIATELEQISLSENKGIATPSIAGYFTLLDALKRGRSTNERIIALEFLLSGRMEDPAKVFNGIAYRLGSKHEAEKFADYDIAVKSGKLEYEDILLDLALRG